MPGSSCPGLTNMEREWCFCRSTRAIANVASNSSSGSCPRRDSGSWAGARFQPRISPLGETARASEPFMKVFIAPGAGLEPMAFERKLFVIRKRAAHDIRGAGFPGSQYFYVPSLSHKTLVYKGMLLTEQVERECLSGPGQPRDGNGAGVRPIPGLAPTHFRAGSAPTRTGTWRTTARSTRCAGISIGCTRGRRCSVGPVRRRHQEDFAHHRHERQRVSTATSEATLPWG